MSSILNILKCCTHTQIFLFYRVSYFNLNRTKYSVLQELDVDLDLIEIFSLKISSTCSPGLKRLSTFGNINITEDLKNFQYSEFKQDWSLSS